MQTTYTLEELKQELKGSNQGTPRGQKHPRPGSWQEEFKEHPAQVMARVEEILEVLQGAIQRVNSQRELNELETLIFHAAQAAKLHLRVTRLPGIPIPKEDPKEAMEALARQIEAMNL